MSIRAEKTAGPLLLRLQREPLEITGKVGLPVLRLFAAICLLMLAAALAFWPRGVPGPELASQGLWQPLAFIVMAGAAVWLAVLVRRARDRGRQRLRISDTGIESRTDSGAWQTMAWTDLDPTASVAGLDFCRLVDRTGTRKIVFTDTLDDNGDVLGLTQLALRLNALAPEGNSLAARTGEAVAGSRLDFLQTHRSARALVTRAAHHLPLATLLAFAAAMALLAFWPYIPLDSKPAPHRFIPVVALAITLYPFIGLIDQWRHRNDRVAVTSGGIRHRDGKRQMDIPWAEIDTDALARHHLVRSRSTKAGLDMDLDNQGTMAVALAAHYHLSRLRGD